MSVPLPSKEDLKALKAFQRANLLASLVDVIMEEGETQHFYDVLDTSGILNKLPSGPQPSQMEETTETAETTEPSESVSPADQPACIEDTALTAKNDNIYLKPVPKLQGLSENTTRKMASIFDKSKPNPALFRNAVMRAPVSRYLLQSMIMLNGGVASFSQLETIINEIGAEVAAKNINSNTLRGRISLWMKDGFISPIPAVQGSYTMSVAQAKEAIERNEDFSDIDLDALFPPDERGEAVQPKK